ncbi:MAG: ABC transporter substrate-binding protein [Desulfobacterales bacterium]|nr:ABC transporter substrate-binding protein [Desulfobacterales bacterium]
MQKFAVLLFVVLALVLMGSRFSHAREEVKIATWEDISSMDPGWMVSSARELVVLDCLYDGLVTYKEGTFEVIPQLAESWDQSPDGKEIVFHLKKGVQFHKGYGEMTAEDVKFSFDRVIAPDSDATEKETFSSLKQVEILDKYRVKFTFEKPMSQLFTSALPGPSGMVVCKKAAREMGREKYGQNPIGTGPYEFVSWEPKKKLVLESFDGYWGSPAKNSRLAFMPIVEDTTCEIALKTKEVHVGRCSMVNLQAFKRNPRMNLVTKPDLRYWFIGFTQNHPPFDNKHLREALRWSVDVDKAINAAFFGGADRAKTVVPPGVVGHWKDAPLRKVDLDKAKECLKMGGKPEGFSATVNVFLGDTPKILAEVIKADAARVGIDLKLNVQETGAFNDANLAGKHDMFIDVWGTTTDPSDSTIWWVADNKWNITHWNNPEFDKIVGQATSELDLEKRTQLYMKTQQIMDDECWGILLTHGTRIVAATQDVDLGQVYPNGNLAPWTISLK